MKHWFILLCFCGGLALAQISPLDPTNPPTPQQPTEPLLPPPEPVPAAPVVSEPAQFVVPPPLTLRLTTREPILRQGRLETITSTQLLELPAASAERSRLEQRLSSGVEDFLTRLERQLRTEQPEDARFVREQGVWVARQKSAWRLDKVATRNALRDALRRNRNQVEAVLQRIAPKRGVEAFVKRGIRHHLGGGGSSYAGSPSFREQNILAAVRQLDNRFLPRGAVFSFNQQIGISQAEGYVPGYIIVGGGLSKDIGGGICQVSTTVWRAAYLVGLPILERHQHSYHVHYYDPPGFEATVFAPSKNLRFANDTKNDLWLQFVVNRQTKELELHFFGAVPDRRVEISAPRIWNERPAPKDRFMPDPNLKLGEVSIISGAENGFEVLYTRTVRYQNGTAQNGTAQNGTAQKITVRRDQTQSRYVPWGAIYAVHPKDPRLRSRR